MTSNAENFVLIRCIWMEPMLPMLLSLLPTIFSQRKSQLHTMF